MSEHQKIPGGRLARLARLAAVGVRSGTSLLTGGDGGGAAAAAAEALGTLRGLAAKVGQMASYVDGVVPEGQRDAYEGAMRALRAAAPASDPAAVRRTVEEELQGPIDQLFARFSEQPVASASIGQVHHALLPDGREVAVKVQHAGIVKAVESDLKNAGVLEAMVSAMGGKRFDPKGMLEVVQRRMREELDYKLEAARITEFRALHEGDPEIRIPAVVPERSTGRVLTTEFVRGQTFEEAQGAPPAERRRYCETLWRFVFKGNLAGGMFNADPHPGNYIFQGDGQVAFLDFGCVQPIDGEHLNNARALHKAALRRDEAAFMELAPRVVHARPGRLLGMSARYMRRCFDPIFHSPYRVTRPFAASLVEEMKEMAKVARVLPEAEVFAMPKEMLFINRLQFGFYSVLARFDVEADYASVESGFVPQL